MLSEKLIAHEEIKRIGQAAKAASTAMAAASSEAKNHALETLARLIDERKAQLQQANAEDLRLAQASGLAAAFIDRLRLSDKVIDQMVQGLKQIVSLPDPIGEISELKPQPSGIQVGKMRSPLGVIGIIYESRPNVTIDAAALCLKSGNAAILRGGSEAKHSNAALAQLIGLALGKAGLPEQAVQVITNPDRDLVGALITARDWVDIIIPRGGKGLISRLMAEATVPMIKHLDGVCHTYVDDSADLAMALSVCDNAKTQRYSPCNAMETLLVSEAIAEAFLPKMLALLAEKGVELRCDDASGLIAQNFGIPAQAASQEDWSAEYNAPILSVKVVSGLQEAIEHINCYGSHHTDAIITNNLQNAQRFLRQVDSSSVMLNTSTRFADGFEYGLGAEIGISTDKLHARGPVGLEGLTSEKYIVLGHGELRQ